MKTKFYLKQSDGSEKEIEFDLPLKEAVINWQWEHDPLNLMPFLSLITLFTLLPVMVIALLLAIALYPLKYANNAIGYIAHCLNETCRIMTNNHTRLTLKEEDFNLPETTQQMGD